MPSYQTLSPWPKKLPYLPTTENVPLVEKYILEKFKDNTFKKSKPFPSISTKPTHIHLKTGYTQYAQHAPISIALHWKEEVKQSLNEDLVIEPVSIGEPVKWWSKMIVIPRNDGRSRRTISLQQPSAQCQRETHHCQSPFKVVCQVPPNMKKPSLTQWMATMLFSWMKPANPSQSSSWSGNDTAAIDFHKDALQTRMPIYRDTTNLSRTSQEKSNMLMMHYYGTMTLKTLSTILGIISHYVQIKVLL